MKKIITFLALMLPTLAFAQWRVGANVGLSYNHPTIDKQYMTDLEYKDRYGVTFGMMGQYDFNDLQRLAGCACRTGLDAEELSSDTCCL